MMTTLRTALLLTFTLASQHATAAMTASDIQRYGAAQKWTSVEPAALKMPVDDILPFLYAVPGSGGQACGLLARGPGAPVYIDVLSSDEDSSFPSCGNIYKVAAFKLAGKSWLAFEFWHIDDDKFADYFYVRRNDAGYWEKARDASDRVERSPLATANGEHKQPASIQDGIRNVRANHMAKSFKGQHMLYRDFIGDDEGAFGVLSSPGACTFVVDAGATRATFRHDEFAPGQPCAAFVASSRMEQGATTYYIGLFDGAQKKRQLALFSVRQNVIKAEKELAAQAASKGQLSDIKSVKRFLSMPVKP